MLLTRLLPFAVLLAACSGEEAAPRASGPTDAHGFPRTLEAFGDKVQVASKPMRILPGTAAALDLLVDLVGPERIVAVPFTAPEYANAPLAEADWERLTTFRRFEGEDLLPLRPDLVVTHAYQRAEAVRVLRQAGVAVVRLPDVERYEDLLAQLETLGALVGEEERAAERVRELERRRAALAADTSLVGVRALTYLDLGTGGWTSGTGTTGDLLIRLAGLHNAATDAGLAGNVEIDHERLVMLDPDLLIVRSTVEDDDSVPTAELLRANTTLAGLRAVREDRILVLPARLFAAESHYVLDGAELLAARAKAMLAR